MKIILHAFTISLSQMGVYVWYQVADFGIKKWVTAYYIWDKSILLLLVLCCISPVKIMRPYWIVTSTFFAIRLASEFAAIFYDIGKLITNYRLMFLINFLCTLLTIRMSQSGKCPKL